MNVNKDPVIIIKQKYHKEVITGSRRISNYFWVIVLGLGGIGFSFSGLSSYFKINLLPFIDISDLIFIPQGILMLFYGTLSIVVSIFLLLTIIWDVGGGYNEYDVESSLVRIVRKTTYGLVAQWTRARGYEPRCRRFDSPLALHGRKNIKK
jgi:hypothetical protein